jgi:hypothetical protein
VLDGINGLIQLYNQNNTEILRLNPANTFPAEDSGNFVLNDINGTKSIKMDSQGGFRFYDPTTLKTRVYIAPSIISLVSTIPSQSLSGFAGFIDLVGYPLDNDLLKLHMGTGYSDAAAILGSTDWRLYSPKKDFSQPPFHQAGYKSLHASSPRPRIDLTGPGGVAGQEARTVVHDLWYGAPTGEGSLPTETGSYPRGQVAFGVETTSPIVLSTTAGTYTQIVESSAFNAIAGRCYKISFFGSSNLLVAGSGFTTTDSWDHKMQLKVGAGAYADAADVTIITRIFRLQVAAATRAPIPNHTAIYRPAANASVQIRLAATKSSGAATVTSQYEGGPSSAFYILVEDIGLAP